MTGSDSPPLFDLLPQIVRGDDVRQPSRPLETLFSVLQGAYDDVERDVSALYDEWFVETCGERTVARIAALVGVEVAEAAAPWSRRALVANSLVWRGRPGTLATLAQAVASASGWPAAAGDLGAEIATSAAMSPAPGPAAVVRVARHGVSAPHGRLQRTVGVCPAPPARGGGSGAAYVAPGAVSLQLWTLPVFFLEGIEPVRRGSVLACHPAGLASPFYVAPEVFAPAVADPGLLGLPRPLTRRLLRSLLARPKPRLPLAIRQRGAAGWTEVAPDRLRVARLDPGAAPPARGNDVLIDPERGFLAFGPDAPQPLPADLRVDHGLGFGGPVGAGAWSRSRGAAPCPRARPIRLVAEPDDLADALARWDRASALEIRIVDGGRYAAPGGILELRPGALLSISARPGARPVLDGALAVAGDGAKLELEGLHIAGGLTVRGAGLAMRGCTAGLATACALRVEAGADTAVVDIADSVVGPVACDATRLNARRTVLDGRPDLDALPGAAIRGTRGDLSPTAVDLDRCTVLGDLRLARAPTLARCAVDGTVEDPGGVRRLRAQFVTRKPGDPYYLQSVPDGPVRAGDGAFGGQDRARRLHAVDVTVARHLPQGLACAVVLAS